jgi:hypothetical protein
VIAVVELAEGDDILEDSSAFGPETPPGGGLESVLLLIFLIFNFGRRVK